VPAEADQVAPDKAPDSATTVAAKEMVSAGPICRTVDLPAEQGGDRRGPGSMLEGIWQSTRTILQRNPPDDVALSEQPLPSSTRVQETLDAPCSGHDLVSDVAQPSPVVTADSEEAHRPEGPSKQTEGSNSNPSEDTAAVCKQPDPSACLSSLGSEACAEGLPADQSQSTVECSANKERTDTATSAPASGQATRTPDAQAECALDRRGPGSVLGGIWQSTRTILQRKGSPDTSHSPRPCSAATPSQEGDSHLDIQDQSSSQPSVRQGQSFNVPNTEQLVEVTEELVDDDGSDAGIDAGMVELLLPEATEADSPAQHETTVSTDQGAGDAVPAQANAAVQANAAAPQQGSCFGGIWRGRDAQQQQQQQQPQATAEGGRNEVVQ